MGTATVRLTDSDGNVLVLNPTYDVLAATRPETDLQTRYFVDGHPQFGGTVYDTDAWLPEIAAFGAYGFRGMYAIQQSRVRDRLAQAKALGLKWLAVLGTLDNTDAELIARLDHMRLNAVGTVVAIEPVNEPDGGGLTDAEAARVAAMQKLVWQYVTVDHKAEMAGITVLCSPLRMPAGDALYQKIVDAGIVGNYDAVAVHHYNGDQAPDLAGLSAHLDRVFGFLGTNRAWITETGYTNALSAPKTQRPSVSEAASAVYGLRNLLTFTDEPRVEAVGRYEACDDPNAANDNTERNFGLVRCPSLDPTTWTRKPEFAETRRFLRATATEPFTAQRYGLRVTAPAGVSWRLTQAKGEAPMLWLYRPDTSVWVNDADVVVPTVAVQVTTHGGILSANVGGAVVGLQLPA